MKTPWGLKLKLKKKTKEEQRAARKEGAPAGGVVKISLKIPTGLQKRIISWCGERELKVTDELQAALEAYFPADAAPAEEPTSGEAIEAAPRPAAKSSAES